MAEKAKVSKLLVVTIGAIGLACLLGLAVGLSLFTVERPLPPFTEPSLSRLGKYRTAAVSSDGVPCSEIGRDIMKDGGNAMDAAIATLFCIGVVNPQSAGIGGGFLMTIYDSKTGTARCLDARETAPDAATQDMFNGNATLSQTGGLSIAVPGELKGYWEAHQVYGKLPWSRLILPAAFLAEKGLNINWHLASALVRRESLIKAEPTLWEFINKSNGQVKVEGDKYSMPALAKTLKTIAQKGIEAFYEGEIGEKFVQDVKERGGIITREDLINYEVKWVDPVKTELSDSLTLYSIPPPGSGALTAYILNILKNLVPWKKESARDPLTYHQMAEAFKYAFAHRTKLADPYNNTRVKQLAENLTSESLATEARNKINNLKTVNDPEYYGAVSYNPDDHGTSHVSTLDKDGLAVSVTSTVNLLLGAGFISEQTGIIPNNEMDDFSSPSIVNYFGMPPSEANFIRKNRRPLSSMTPTIIVNSTSNQVRLVIGAAGGTKITTSVAYVIIRNLWFGETIKEAIDSKRIHHQLFPMTFQYEKGFPSEILDEIMSKGHNISSYSSSSTVCAISVEPNGLIRYANSDHRKRGDVAGIDPL